MPTVSTPSSTPGMAEVSTPVRSSTGGISTALSWDSWAAGVSSSGVVSSWEPQAAREAVMARAISNAANLLMSFTFLKS